MKKMFLPLVLLILITLVSCNDSKLVTRTSLSLKIKDETNSRTIMPSSSLMNVQKYKVSGISTDGSSFGPLYSNENEMTINDIALGSWQITVSALNAENNSIATGTSTVVIKKGRNDFTLALDTVPGNGSLNINLTWDQSISSDQYITIITTLENSSGTKTEKTKIVQTSDGKLSSFYNMAAGSYIMNIRVSDTLGEIDCGATEVVRIVDNTRTTGDIKLQNYVEEDDSKVLELTIDNRIGPPMVFYIDYFPKNPVKGQVMTLKSCITSIPSNVDKQSLTYQWYKDGVLQTDGSAVNYAIVTDSGIHRYDVVIKSDIEGTMCSASIVLNIPYS